MDAEQPQQQQQQRARAESNFEFGYPLPGTPAYAALLLADSAGAAHSPAPAAHAPVASVSLAQHMVAVQMDAFAAQLAAAAPILAQTHAFAAVSPRASPALAFSPVSSSMSVARQTERFAMTQVHSTPKELEERARSDSEEEAKLPNLPAVTPSDAAFSVSPRTGVESGKFAESQPLLAASANAETPTVSV